MELFDSHAHYDDEKFNEDRDEIIEKIYSSGVTKFMCAGYNLESSINGIKLADKYDYIYTTSGISPNDVNTTIEETKKDIVQLRKNIIDYKDRQKKENKIDKIVGIGEIGLDYYWNAENKDVQNFAFIEQIKLANELNLPIVIHTREAVMDTLNILKQNLVNRKGVFHCCPFNRELVKEALKLGFYISIAGTVTFKNAKNAKEIIEMIPLNRLLIETDSPYLAPEPVRGTRNDSRNVKYIAEKIAEFKNMKATYYMNNGGVLTVNYAYEQDGITMYPDLVKVKIALDNGEVLGIESTGYLNCHRDTRELSDKKITLEEARSKVNQNLNVSSSGLAVIPTEWGTEVLCYEFKGNTAENDFIVYINAETGEEEDILMIINTPEGTLTE